MVRCLIGLGSNVGDRAATLSRAVELLGELAGVHIIGRSTWHATAPIGGPAEQGEFLNGAVTIETSLDARALLSDMRDVEARLGRRRLERWGPRTIDLDLLLYGEQVLETPEITVPHPRLAVRGFVLKPARQVAADWLHPTVGWTIERLWQHLHSTPNYVAITGNIATGKSSLAARVAQRTAVRLIHESVDPQRLAAFYGDPAGRGLATELEFLAERRAQLGAVQSDMVGAEATEPWWLSDFWFDQSLAFARVWLSDEQQQYVIRQWQMSRASVPRPKLLVLLEAPTGVLLRRIAKRGRQAEQSLTADELNSLNAALQRQVAESYEGPLLRLSADDLGAATVEVAAALEGMRPPHDSRDQ